jgi:hypothetical protein
MMWILNGMGSLMIMNYVDGVNQEPPSFGSSPSLAANIFWRKTRKY